MGDVREARSAALSASIKSFGSDDAANSALFTVNIIKELHNRKLATETLDCIDTAWFESRFKLGDASQFTLFAGYAIDYICSESTLEWDGDSTKDGLSIKKFIPKTVELLHATRYVRLFIDMLSQIGFLDILARMLTSVDPSDVNIGELDSDITIEEGSMSFTVKSDAFQQAVACINLHYARNNLTQKHIDVCEIAKHH